MPPTKGRMELYDFIAEASEQSGQDISIGESEGADAEASADENSLADVFPEITPAVAIQPYSDITLGVSNFSGLKAAVDAVNDGTAASNTIKIALGFSFEDKIQIEKDINFEASDPSQPVVLISATNKVHFYTPYGTTNAVTMVFQNIELDGAGHAGGIRSEESDHLTVKGVTIRNCKGANYGGRIYSFYDLTVEDCRIINNEADISGGGLHSGAGDIIISGNSDISGNRVDADMWMGLAMRPAAYSEKLGIRITLTILA